MSEIIYVAMSQHPSAYRADLPPSTRYEAPVMNEALSDARKVMVLATSAAVPPRLSGAVAASLAFLSAVPVKRCSIPVSTGPGETMMLHRFTGTAERKASLAATVPLNRVGTAEE